MRRRDIYMKMKRNAVLWITTLSLFVTYAQTKKGYWDTMRTTTETFDLRAGEKKVIKTNPLPEGTTELVYRITLLDDNQKMSSSLVAVLKAIPDPTGIAQGAAGAVFLASTISGKDKATFSIFTNENDANTYLTSDQSVNACYVQNTPVNKEARLLAAGQLCVAEPRTNLWFGFKSDNWLMQQKVVLEVVPWIDNEASRGWTESARKELSNWAKKREVYPFLVQKEDFQVTFVKQVMAKTTYFNYKKLDAAERNQLGILCEKEALQRTGELEKRSEQIASTAFTLFNKGKTEEGIGKLQAEIHSGTKDAVLYATLIQFYLQSRQINKAATCLKDAPQNAMEDLRMKLAEAHVYLFTDNESEAKALYKKYASQNFPNGKPWKEQVLIDLNAFERSGLPTNQFAKIKRLLE